MRWRSRTVTLDWLRTVHPAEERSNLVALLRSVFGPCEERSGKFFYAEGVTWGNAACVFWGSRAGSKETCCVDLTGGALAELDPHARIELCRRLARGARVTRLDVAVDAFDPECVGLIAAATAGCAAGELCGARIWEPREAFSCGERVAYGLNLGRRGRDGSGRYVRAYDKGLEQRTLPEGRWERFEVEFSGDCANEVAVAVLDSGDWERAAFERACGAVGWREVNGRSELGRRPVVEWWEKWCEGYTPQSTTEKRRRTSLDRYTAWLRDTVLPTVRRLALQADQSMAGVIETLIGRDRKVRARDLKGDMFSMVLEYHSASRMPWEQLRC
ncbi:MAG: replication initiation factor domain-containing protein [Planctomycetota bacterium]